MKGFDRIVLVVAISLGVTGLLAALMVAILRGRAGDWGYLVVFILVMSFGIPALVAAMKRLSEVSKGGSR